MKLPGRPRNGLQKSPSDEPVEYLSHAEVTIMIQDGGWQVTHNQSSLSLDKSNILQIWTSPGAS